VPRLSASTFPLPNPGWWDDWERGSTAEHDAEKARTRRAWQKGISNRPAALRPVWLALQAKPLVLLLTLAPALVKGGFKDFAGNDCSPASGDNIMAKPATIKIRLNSTAGTGHFYVTKKNARTMTEKMVVRKYDPVKREHVEYKEGKIK